MGQNLPFLPSKWNPTQVKWATHIMHKRKPSRLEQTMVTGFFGAPTIKPSMLRYSIQNSAASPMTVSMLLYIELWFCCGQLGQGCQMVDFQTKKSKFG
jgi:hypothetical protein